MAAIVALLLGLVPLVVVTPAAAEPRPNTTEITSAAGFVHPGVFVNLEELQASRALVKAGKAPWATIYNQMAAAQYQNRQAPTFRSFASAANPAKPCSDIDPAGCVSNCGPANNPNVGCSDELDDGFAVYAQALLWWYTGKATYAHRAIAILNSYADHFKGHVGSNGPLMASWAAEMMIRGAEIIRYTYSPEPGDPTFDIAGFSRMLQSAFVDRLVSFDFGNLDGNWKLSAADGLMNLAVFLDDRKLYDRSIVMWRERVRSYIYLSTDGPHPVLPNGDRLQTSAALGCFWLANKSPACKTNPQKDPRATYQNGQAQESCRDFNHTSAGFAGIINAAETAWIQGDDLYGEEQRRIMTGVSYAVEISQNRAIQGWPANFCNNVTPLAQDVSLQSLPADVVYNAYTVRKHVRFTTVPVPGYNARYPNGDPLAAYIKANRRARDPVTRVNAWETLTSRTGAPTRTPPAKPTGEPTPQQPQGPGSTPAPPVTPAADSTPEHVGSRVAQAVRTGLIVVLSLTAIAVATCVGVVIGRRSGRRRP